MKYRFSKEKCQADLKSDWGWMDELDGKECEIDETSHVGNCKGNYVYKEWCVPVSETKRYVFSADKCIKSLLKLHHGDKRYIYSCLDWIIDSIGKEVIMDENGAWLVDGTYHLVVLDWCEEVSV